MNMVPVPSSGQKFVSNTRKNPILPSIINFEQFEFPVSITSSHFLVLKARPQVCLHLSNSYLRVSGVTYNTLLQSRDINN